GRSRGTPRIANRLLKRVRDISQVGGEIEISLQTAKEALDMLQVDRAGLDHIDHKLLKGIMEDFQGGQVGLDTIAAPLVEEKETIPGECEPLRLQLGFSQRTPRGRIATELSYEHFGIRPD